MHINYRCYKWRGVRLWAQGWWEGARMSRFATVSIYLLPNCIIYYFLYIIFLLLLKNGRERERRYNYQIMSRCFEITAVGIYLEHTYFFVLYEKKSRPLWQTFRDKKEDKTCTPIFAVVYLEKYCRVKRIPTVSNKPTEVSLDENHTLLSPARFVASLPFVYLIKGLLYTDLNLADAGLKKPVFWSLKGADGSHILLTLSYLLLESIER